PPDAVRARQSQHGQSGCNFWRCPQASWSKPPRACRESCVIARWNGRPVLSLRKLLMGSAGSRPRASPNSILAVPGISEAIRPVFFQTDLDDFLYATHGGTLFLISFQGRSYALTCRHVF